MAYYDNPGQINDEAINIAGGKTFQVIQIAYKDGNIIDPAEGSVVFNGEVSISNEVEIKNNTGNPVGTVIYNPLGNPSGTVTVTFSENRKKASTGTVATSHTVAAFDGDIFTYA